MTRTTRGNVAKKRRKKIIRICKGFRGSHSTIYTTANQQIMKSLRYAYFDRKKRKNLFKKLWTTRINITAKKYNINFQKLISNLKKEYIIINKKILSKVSIIDLKVIEKLIIKAKILMNNNRIS